MKSLIIAMCTLLSLSAYASLPCSPGATYGEFIKNTFKDVLAKKGITVKTISIGKGQVLENNGPFVALYDVKIVTSKGEVLVPGGQNCFNNMGCDFSWEPGVDKQGRRTFQGCRVVYMPEISNAATGQIVIPEHKEPSNAQLQAARDERIAEQAQAEARRMSSQVQYQPAQSPVSSRIVGSSCTCSTTSPARGNLIRFNVHADGRVSSEILCFNLMKDKYTFDRSCEGLAADCDVNVRCPQGQ